MATYNHENLGEVNKYAFLEATVTSVDTDNDTVDLSGDSVSGSAVPLFYHCLDDSAEQENGSLEGAASAFSEDDEVIVMCEISDIKYTPVRVVGFTDGPKECYNEYLVINCHDYYLVWDCRGNRAATITDPVSGDPIIFPAEAADMANWIAASTEVSVDNCYAWTESTGYSYDAGTGLNTADNIGCGELTWLAGTQCGGSTIVDVGLCSGGVRFGQYSKYIDAIKVYNSYGSSYSLELLNPEFSGETTCFRTEQYPGLSESWYYPQFIGYTGRTHCMSSTYRYFVGVPGTSNPCDLYKGNPYKGRYPDYPQANGTHTFDTSSGAARYSWHTPIGELDAVALSGMNRIISTKFTKAFPYIGWLGNRVYGDSIKATTVESSEVITLQDFYSYKGAVYSEKTMYQIYLVQYATINPTTIGSDPPVDIANREQQVAAVCGWSNDVTVEDPRDQESDTALSDAISDLMDHAATNVPFADTEVVSSFSTSIRTTFV